jgi:3-dehydroquinate synthase
MELHPSIFAQFADRLVVIEPEHKKDIRMFTEVCEQLISHKVKKNFHLIGVGGGLISDLVGFVASVYMRGVSVSFVPTTVLGMVDASIGGKNALNFGTIKNIVGTIHHPENVYLHLNFLKTLPHSEFMSGMAEVAKTAFLFDYELVHDTLLFLNKFNINAINIMKLTTIITESITHKMAIVNNDVYDNSERNLLNFGHTIGHLLELEYGLMHGFAVAQGMVLETQLAMILELTDGSVYNRVRRILGKYFLTDMQDFDLKKIIDKIVYDKKANGDTILLPVIDDIGSSHLYEVKLVEFYRLINARPPKLPPEPEPELTD